MTPEERDRIERRALTFFNELYGDQASRTTALVSADEAEMLRLIGELYRTEAETGAAAYAGFWRAVMVTVAAGSLRDANVPADSPAYGEDGGLSPVLDANLERYLAEMARIFGQRYSENSLELVYSAIDRWRQGGGTVGDLRDIMRPIWEGPRPVAASITETTRVVVETEGAAWQEAGLWGFDVRTRNDGLVRPTHQAVADGGPYPWSMFEQKKPPINGDVGCRCTLSPVAEDPNG